MCPRGRAQGQRRPQGLPLCILGSRLKAKFKNQAKIFQNVRRTYWNKYLDKLKQKLNEQILPPVPVPSSKEDNDVLANNEVHSVIIKLYEAACPMLCESRFVTKTYIWWNFEQASLRKEARRAWRKAIKTKQEEDWRLKSSP